MNTIHFQKNAISVLTVLFVAILSVIAQAQNNNDILIEPPLTWSVNSIQIVWSVSQGATQSEEMKFIYDANQILSDSSTEENVSERKTQRGATFNGGMRVDMRAGLESNPLTLFGLLGAKVNASSYIEGGFNYNRSYGATNTSIWSESEKNVVNKAITSAFTQNAQTTISNQRLVFTVDFVNHTKSRLYFSPDSDNTIPIYCDGTHIGDAKLINANASIAATGKPIPCRFAMELNDTGKKRLVNHRPIIQIENGQLLIQSLPNAKQLVEDAIQDSIVSSNYFTVAILSGNDVKEWKVKNTVSFEDALNAINEQVCAINNSDDKKPFEIKNNQLKSVCNIPFNNTNKSDWIAELIIFHGDNPQIIDNPDSSLGRTPSRGDRYVFVLENQQIKKLIDDAEAGDAQAQYELSKRYYNGDGVQEDKQASIEWCRKAAEQGLAKAQLNLGKIYYLGLGVPVDKKEGMIWINKAVDQQHSPAKKFLAKLEKEFNGEYAGERKTFTVNGIEFAFRWCPAGTFTMGSPKGEEGKQELSELLKVEIDVIDKWEKQHQVTLTKGFWMMETEVTVGMFKAFVNETGYESKGLVPFGIGEDGPEQNAKFSWRNPGFVQNDSHPVTCVSWDDAVAFCKWLSKKTEQNVQLPTEAQWEYACRAGTTERFVGDIDRMAWYWNNSNKSTHPVGTKKSNTWGLYDMHGNVWEWCADWVGVYPDWSITDPTGPAIGSDRVHRGGGWGRYAWFCRSADRDGGAPGFRCYGLGFRPLIGQ